jgi:hypothetical protein
MRYFILAVIALTLCGCSHGGSNPPPTFSTNFDNLVIEPITTAVVTQDATSITIVVTNVSDAPVTVSIGTQEADDPADFHTWHTAALTSYTIAPGASITHTATVVGWARAITPFLGTFTFFGVSA